MKKTVKIKGLQIWRQGIQTKTTLKYYKTKEKPAYEAFYDGSWESSLLFKARSGALETRDRTNRWREDNWWCEWCLRENVRARETIEHLLVECGNYTQARRELEHIFQEEYGVQEWEVRKQGEDQGINTVLGFQDPTPNTIQATKLFLRQIWKNRLNIEGGHNHMGDHNYY